MVRSRCRVLACAMLLGVSPVQAQVQASPGVDIGVQVGVRPRRVRVGDMFVLTVRVVGRAVPESVALVGSPAAEVVDVRDRSSTALGRGGMDMVLERDFVLRALGAGSLGPLQVQVVAAGDTVMASSGPVEAVGSPVAWAPPPAPRARRDEKIVLDQGVPPSAQGRDADREWAPQGLFPPGYPGYPYLGAGTGYGATPQYPGDVYPGMGYPGAPYAPTGWGVAPLGEGWAPSAAGDPWWPELVPELSRYQTGVEDPTGIVRLEAGLTPEQVFEGQQVTLLATATFAPEASARLGAAPEFFPPSAGQAWSVDIPYAPPTPAAVRGRVEEAHTFMRAFFPMAPGTLVVEPALLRFGPGAGGRSDPTRDSLATDALAVEVRPLPRRDAPGGWNGAVGRYRVRAWTQPRAVGLGESALLTVEVSGVGNVRALSRPDPGQVWGAELRAVGERAVVEVRDGVVGGVKTFSWLVVPVEPGEVRIGPVVFAYFDPWIGAFGQVASEEILLVADPFPAGVRAPYGAGSGSRASPLQPVGDPWGTGARGADRRPDAPWDDPEKWVPPQSVPPVGEKAAPAAAAPTSLAMESLATESLATESLATESLAQALADRVSADPDDAGAWLALGQVYAQVRPGEGWSEWAFANGLRAAPRHAGLRSALGASPAWADAGRGGFPLLPLSAAESLALGLGLGLLGVGSGLAAMRATGTGSAGSGRRTARLLVVAAAVASALVALEPWSVLRRGDTRAIAVEGPVEIRLAPSLGADVVGRVASGTSLRLGERYGAWVRVRAGGTDGWAEGTRVAPLGSRRSLPDSVSVTHVPSANHNRTSCPAPSERRPRESCTSRSSPTHCTDDTTWAYPSSGSVGRTALPVTSYTVRTKAGMESRRSSRPSAEKILTTPRVWLTNASSSPPGEHASVPTPLSARVRKSSPSGLPKEARIRPSRVPSWRIAASYSPAKYSRLPIVQRSSAGSRSNVFPTHSSESCVARRTARR